MKATFITGAYFLLAQSVLAQSAITDSPAVAAFKNATQNMPIIEELIFTTQRIGPMNSTDPQALKGAHQDTNATNYVLVKWQSPDTFFIHTSRELSSLTGAVLTSNFDGFKAGLNEGHPWQISGHF